MKYTYIITCDGGFGNDILFTTLKRENIKNGLERSAFYFDDELDFDTVVDNLNQILYKNTDQILDLRIDGSPLGGLARFKLYVMENI